LFILYQNSVKQDYLLLPLPPLLPELPPEFDGDEDEREGEE
jgi:hypothetical protein